MNIGDQQKSHKWQTSIEQLTVWQLGFQWHRRGIELVFKSLDCFTKRPFFTATYVFVVGWNVTRLITRLKSFCFFKTSIWWGSTQLQCIYYLCRILISRPPRVFRRFKRRSCCILPVGQIYAGNVGSLFALPTFIQWCVVMIGNIKTLALYSIAHCTILLSSLNRIVLKHWTYKTLITYVLISVCLW